jgi:hypothetical protein
MQRPGGRTRILKSGKDLVYAWHDRRREEDGKNLLRTQRAGTEIEERGNTYMVGEQAFLPT